MDLLDGDVELTEFEAIDVKSVKGVRQGANGFPILMMKGLPEPAVKADGSHAPFTGSHEHPHPAFGGPDGDGDGDHEHGHEHDGDADHHHSHAAKSAGPPPWHAAAVQLAKLAAAAPSLPRETLFKAVVNGAVDEQPDIDGGKQAIALIAKLIGYEAQELAAGCMSEVWDIQLLCEAVTALKCWLGNEQAAQSGADMDGMVMASAAAKADLSTAALNDLPDSAFAYIEDGGTKDSEGKTTPRSKRHFAIHDKAHADNAAARIAQGAEFGDQAKAKVTAAQKKFGEDTSKSQIAPEGTDVDTVTQGTGDLSEIVEAAVTKAVQPHMERVTALEAELAKVKARPVPGGPMMAAVPQAKAADGADHAAKAAYYDRMAGSLASPQDADTYRQLAAQERAKITAS